MNKSIFALFLSILFLVFSCKQKASSAQIDDVESQSEVIQLKYAKGFQIKAYSNFKVLEILKPWKDSQKIYRFAIINKNDNIRAESLSEKLSKTSLYDGVIISPLQSIVVTSTTHLPALELLDEADKLVGFPGTDYISSKKIRTLIKAGKVKDLGQNNGLNTEILLALNPDAVITFGIESTNKAAENIEKANIPVIYNGEWIEQTPLAKAEWIKMFGVLFNKEEQARETFNHIENEYLKAKATAQKATIQPTVLSGAMYRGVWYLPSGQSPEAQLLKDANTNYLWKDTKEEGSLELSFESVLEKGQGADIWLSPSNYGSYRDLKAANKLYEKFKAFKQQSIFSFVNTKGDTGGLLYFEMGTARPDLVLKDLIKIAHPELMKDDTFTFYKPLKD